MDGRTPGHLVAAIDQAGAALKDVARILGEYRAELVLAGFPPDEAMELCLDLQRDIMLGDLDEDE
jgi:hypothetical protein